MSLLEILIAQIIILLVAMFAYTAIPNPTRELTQTCTQYKENILPSELKPENKEFVSDTTTFSRTSKDLTDQFCSFVVKDTKTSITEVKSVKESTASAKVKAFDLAKEKKENTSENSQNNWDYFLVILAIFTIFIAWFVFSPMIMDKVDDIKCNRARKKREKQEKELEDKLLFEQLKKKNSRIKKQEKIETTKKIYI